MKKFIVQILLALFMVSLVACGGKSNGNKTETQTTVEADPAVTASFEEYVSLVEKSLALVEKINKGDAAARQQWVVSVPKINSLSLELQRSSDKLTKEQNDKVLELSQKYAQATRTFESK